MSKLKTLVIEGDARTRLALANILDASADIEVVGIASDPMQARMQVKLRKPDVLVLAIDDSTACADTFLLELMQISPKPLVMLSAQILPASRAQRQALRSAASTILVKPSDGISTQDKYFANQLIQQVQQMAAKAVMTTPGVQPDRRKTLKRPRLDRPGFDRTQKKPSASAVASQAAETASATRHRPDIDTLIAIGASTGGTEALRQVVTTFPADSAAVLIVQHIPKAFSGTFIEKLNKAAAMQVVAVSDGLKICKGHIYVGACDEHFRIERQAMGFVCRLGGKDKINGHCPSVNALFDSVAQHAGAKAVGALMTGMGDDGASGLKKMRQARARTVAQDKQSSVVWGMPGAAVKLDAAEFQVHLDDLAEQLIKLAG